MKTGMGIIIREADLTHEFIWKGKTIPIGRFDPSAYPEMEEARIEELGTAVYDQLEDSRVLSDEEHRDISYLTDAEFNSCIRERK